VDSAITPLLNMGQQLYEPPDVNGWAVGAEWFSTASMLARMNYANYFMGYFSGPLAAKALYAFLLNAEAQTPQQVIEALAYRFGKVPLTPETRQVMAEYLTSQTEGFEGLFSVTLASTDFKVRNLIRLILSVPEYLVH
jgi:hypothetical protein